MSLICTLHFGARFFTMLLKGFTMNFRVCPELIERLHSDFANIGTKVGSNEQQRDCSTKRLGYRAAESAAHDHVKNFFGGRADTRVVVDPVGNLFVELPGREAGLAPILIGSHLDTVAAPGHFDGVSGVVAAIAMASYLLENDIRLRHPFRVSVWRCEESSRFGKAMLGSKWFAGVLPTEELLSLKDQSGLLLADEMADLGLRPDLVAERAEKFDRRVAGYLEIHTEQWDTLKRLEQPVGLVSGFKGTYRSRFTLKGQSAHSGTAEMSTRKDPVVAMASMLTLIEGEIQRRLAESSDASLVATTGYLWSNGSMNQIASEAGFCLDVRDLDLNQLVSTFEKLKEEFERVAQERGVLLNYSTPELVAPVQTSTTARGVLEQAAKTLKLDAPLLPSGAGHDAVPLLSQGQEAAMIFFRADVRQSEGAYSHSWTEFSTMEDIAVASELGLQWLLDFDKSVE